MNNVWIEIFDFSLGGDFVSKSDYYLLITIYLLFPIPHSFLLQVKDRRRRARPRRVARRQNARHQRL